MIQIFSSKSEVFGLDISDLSLKLIKLKKEKNLLTLSSFGEEKIKPGIIKQGEIKGEEELVKIIEEAINNVQGDKITTNCVIASLPEEKTFLQVIKMPLLSEEDLKSAVVYEAENYIPLPIEDVYLDFQVIPSTHQVKHLEVLITALPKNIVQAYLSCLKKAGLKPLVLELESLAIARALIKKETTTSPIALIDFGATRTGFVVFSGHSVRFTSSILVSSRSFTEIIAKALQVDSLEADKLKIKYGLERKNKKGEEVFRALIPALVDLVEQIKKYINYYQTHISSEHLSSENNIIEKVLLCGGGINLKGLPEFLSQELKIPVEIGNPWVNILPEAKKETIQLPPEQSLSYTTALGLALRALKR